MPPVFPLFHGFTHEATPCSKSAMMLLVTLSYRAEMCMYSSSLPASENSGAGVRGRGLGSSYKKTKALRRGPVGSHCAHNGVALLKFLFRSVMMAAITKSDLCAWCHAVPQSSTVSPIPTVYRSRPLYMYMPLTNLREINMEIDDRIERAKDLIRKREEIDAELA